MANSVVADSIRLHDQAGSAATAVTLAQVAELEGEYAESLGETVVGRFGEGQTDLEVQIATLRRTLTEAGVNWADLSLRGRSVCVVTRLPGGDAASVEIDNDRAAATNHELKVADPAASLTVRDLLRQELAAYHEAESDELEIIFRGGADDAAWLGRSLAVGRYDVEVGGRSGLGRVPLLIHRLDPSGTIDRVTLHADVSRRTTAVVVSRAIRRGETLTPQNVELREVWLTADHGEAIDRVDLVVGQVAAGSLRQDAILTAGDVAPDVLVRRGELVTVSCVSGGLVVRTVAQASEDGAKGEIIAVRNPETRETVYVTVTGPRRAEVGLAASGSSLAEGGTR
ncbi:MAG: flagellar basal body P-ring formation chaperone FlgA [Planctomycetota bacterium]